MNLVKGLHLLLKTALLSANHRWLGRSTDTSPVTSEGARPWPHTSESGRVSQCVPLEVYHSEGGHDHARDTTAAKQLAQGPRSAQPAGQGSSPKCHVPVHWAQPVEKSKGSRLPSAFQRRHPGPAAPGLIGEVCAGNSRVSTFLVVQPRSGRDYKLTNSILRLLRLLPVLLPESTLHLHPQCDGARRWGLGEGMGP